MPNYLMVNVQIPVEIIKSGKFTLLNKYTKIEISDIKSLPSEGEELLNEKITEYLAIKREKEESEMRETQARIEEIRREQMEKERIHKEEFDKYKRDKEELERMKLAELENIKKEKEEFEKYKKEQIVKWQKEELEKNIIEEELEKEDKQKYMKIDKNDIKMRKHSNVVSFKNLGRKTTSTYTRKVYDQTLS